MLATAVWIGGAVISWWRGWRRGPCGQRNGLPLPRPGPRLRAPGRAGARRGAAQRGGAAVRSPLERPGHRRHRGRWGPGRRHGGGRAASPADDPAAAQRAGPPGSPRLAGHAGGKRSAPASSAPSSPPSASRSWPSGRCSPDDHDDRRYCGAANTRATELAVKRVIIPAAAAAADGGPRARHGRAAVPPDR